MVKLFPHTHRYIITITSSASAPARAARLRGLRRTFLMNYANTAAAAAGGAAAVAAVGWRRPQHRTVAGARLAEHRSYVGVFFVVVALKGEAMIEEEPPFFAAKGGQSAPTPAARRSAAPPAARPRPAAAAAAAAAPSLLGRAAAAVGLAALALVGGAPPRAGRSAPAGDRRSRYARPRAVGPARRWPSTRPPTRGPSRRPPRGREALGRGRRPFRPRAAPHRAPGGLGIRSRPCRWSRRGATTASTGPGWARCTPFAVALSSCR